MAKTREEKALRLEKLPAEDLAGVPVAARRVHEQNQREGCPSKVVRDAEMGFCVLASAGQGPMLCWAQSIEQRRYALTGKGEPHYIEASDVRVARLACWLATQGRGGLRDPDEREVMPDLSGSEDVETVRWLAENIGDQMLAKDAEETAEVLESLQPAGPLRDRAVEKALWIRRFLVPKVGPA